MRLKSDICTRRRKKPEHGNQDIPNDRRDGFGAQDQKYTMLMTGLQVDYAQCADCVEISFVE